MAERTRIHPVVLVGAGPGDPGLITVSGQAALLECDLVIADRLVPRALLDRLPPHVEVVLRGERRSELAQDEINRSLVEAARAGRRVVRLKGGDPFVFGRGGEEAEALAAAGVPFRVVPGVTAAIGAAAYAGIPLTHRGVAGAVAFVTGHEAEDKDGGLVHWEALATGATTLVLYMSVTHLPGVVARLLAAGRAADTPVAVIERGTTSEQRVLVATLADVVERVQKENVAPPALTVVGEVVRLREAIAWFVPGIVPARTMVVVAAQAGDEAVHTVANVAGVEVRWEHPLRVVGMEAELDAVVGRIEKYRWMALTSQHAARELARALARAGRDARALGQCRIACLSGATAEALRDSLRLIADVEVHGGGAALAAAMLGAGLTPDDGPVLFPRAKEGRDELPDALRAAGVAVEIVAAYQAQIEPAVVERMVREAAQRRPDAIAFGSPRGALALLEGGYPLARFSVEGTRVGAIGETTAQALAERGVKVAVIASLPSYAALVSELAEALAPDLESG